MADPLNKHQQRTEMTRQKLLLAGLRVFVRDGFERSRLEDIASEAGYTRGAFYANFANKEDLFIALLEYQATKRRAEILYFLKRNDGRQGVFPKALRQYYVGRALDRDWSILMLEFKLYILRNPEHRAKFAAAYERIREAFHLEVMNSAEWLPLQKPELERRAKILLEVILNGLLLERACDPKRISSAELTGLLGEMFDLLTSNVLPPKRRRLTATG